MTRIFLLSPADCSGLRARRLIDGRSASGLGGLLLRSVEDGDELDYAPIAGAVRHGTRPPKLAPRRARHLQG